MSKPTPPRHLSTLPFSVPYSDEFLSRLPEHDPLKFLAAALGRRRRRDPVTAFSLADLTTYLPCDLMTKVDIASMAHGLECRQPFLDYRVVELAARMPLKLKFCRGHGNRHLEVNVRRPAAQGDPTAGEDGVRRAAGSLVPARTEGFFAGGSVGPERRSSGDISAPRRSRNSSTSTNKTASTTATACGRC